MCMEQVNAALLPNEMDAENTSLNDTQKAMFPFFHPCFSLSQVYCVAIVSLFWLGKRGECGLAFSSPSRHSSPAAPRQQH